MSNSGIPIVEDVAGAVGDVVDVVGDVFEDVGDALGDVAEAIGDVGSWIDDNVLQPMLDDPIKTVATVAAIAAGQPQLVPYINAADAAAKGGDLTDIGKAYAISYAAGEVGGKVGTEVAGQTGSQVAGNVAKGAARGATSATLKGGDPLTGALVGGATAGASEAVSAIGDAFKTEGPNIGVEGETVQALPEYQELGTGITPTTTGEGFNPLAAPEPGLQVGTFAADAPAADYSLVAPEPAAQTYSEQDQSYEIAPAKPTTETGEPDYQIDSSKIELMPSPDQEYDWEGVGKYVLQQGQKALGQTLISKLLGVPTGGPQQRRRSSTGIDVPSPYTDVASGADPTVGLAEVAPSKYDLKTFSNDAGNTINIPFKDDEPQIPIPPGYKEVKMNKGGLAKKRSKKAVNVVQSAPNKPKTRKGLAVKT